MPCKVLATEQIVVFASVEKLVFEFPLVEAPQAPKNRLNPNKVIKFLIFLSLTIIVANRMPVEDFKIEIIV